MKVFFKLTLTAVLTLGVSLSLWSQDTASKLQNLWGAEACAQMVDEGTWDYEVFRQESGHYIQDMNGVKDITEFEDALAFVPANDLQALSLEKIEAGILLAEYNIPVLPNKYGYYRIGDSGVLFIVYPEELIQKLYQQQNP